MIQSIQISPLCIGLDLGDKRSHLIALAPETGEILEDRKVQSTKNGLRKAFEGLPKGRVAIEVGTHSPWVDRLLRSLGFEVYVANPTRLRLITQSDNKTDRADALYLAELAAANPRLLHPIQHRRAETQADRAVLKARQALVGARVKLINCIRGLVKSQGSRLPRGGSSAFHTKVRELIPEELKPAIDPLLDALEGLHEQYKRFEREVDSLCEKHEPTESLRKISGVGPLTSLDFVLTIEDPSRFSKSRSVGSLAGLRPALKSSGKKTPELRITKAGDPMLRKHLVNAAQYILGAHGPDCDLRRWGLKLAARGNQVAKKKAVIAVARKLCVLLHRLWVTGEEYEPFRNAFRRGEATSPMVP